MAERRISTAGIARASRQSALFSGPFAETAAWLVQDAAEAVTQPFYAALDGERRLYWTDDRALAQHFTTKHAAERFAADRMTTDVCVIRRR